MRRLARIVAMVLAICPFGVATDAGVRADDVFELRSAAARKAFLTTAMYVKVFYPLWFYQVQSSLAGRNRLVGPDRTGPILGAVVSPSNDTLYAGAPVDLSGDPVIPTIPATTTSYSLLTVDNFGSIFTTDIPPATPGTYGITRFGNARAHCDPGVSHHLERSVSSGRAAQTPCAPNARPRPMRQTTTPAPASGGGSPPSCSSASAAAKAPGPLTLFQVVAIQPSERWTL